MIEPPDLLDHADRLVRVGPGAEVRRAVSAAYYALFHTLTRAGAAFFVAAGPDTVTGVVRAFEHRTMRRVCASYIGTERARSADPRLVLVAAAFLQLQDGRHSADYDLTATLEHAVGARLVERAIEAVRAWSRIERDPASKEFLAALLLGARWSRRG